VCVTRVREFVCDGTDRRRRVEKGRLDCGDE
jgi:hypothetical protein